MKMENTVDFNVFVGSETGILKGCNLNPKAVIHKNFHKVKALERGHEISCMAWGDEDQNEIIMGLRNQTVKFFDTEAKAFVSSRECLAGEGPIISLGRRDGVLMTAVKSGEVTLWRGEGENVQVNALQGGEFLCKMRQHPSESNIFATGGKESDLTLWDLERPGEPKFKARNVKPDMLQLRIPVWVTDIAYMEDHKTIAVTSRHKHVRLYDPDRQRRPIINFEYEDSPLTSLSVVPGQSNQIVVGTAHGRMARFDLRGTKITEPLNIFKGFAGAVREVVAHPTLPLLFSVSLDRYLRVHHLESSKIWYREYLKSRLNCVLVTKDLQLTDVEPPKPKPLRYKREIKEERMIPGKMTDAAVAIRTNLQDKLAQKRKLEEEKENKKRSKKENENDLMNYDNDSAGENSDGDDSNEL